MDNFDICRGLQAAGLTWEQATHAVLCLIRLSNQGGVQRSCFDEIVALELLLSQGIIQHGR